MAAHTVLRRYLDCLSSLPTSIDWTCRSRTRVEGTPRVSKDHHLAGKGRMSHAGPCLDPSRRHSTSIVLRHFGSSHTCVCCRPSLSTALNPVFSSSQPRYTTTREVRRSCVTGLISSYLCKGSVRIEKIQ